MSWLGLLNFVVLQWFGVRLARVYGVRLKQSRVMHVSSVSGGGLSFGSTAVLGEREFLGWQLLRWVWPLTGWWSSFRWIGRRA